MSLHVVRVGKVLLLILGRVGELLKICLLILVRRLVIGLCGVVWMGGWNGLMFLSLVTIRDRNDRVMTGWMTLEVVFRLRRNGVL